jgi:hypothetical protein
MSTKPHINVCSFRTKTIRVRAAGSAPVDTADWVVKVSDLHVISAGEKAVKFKLFSPVNLRTANRALRGKRDGASVSTSVPEQLESA